jgi:hypothetical protein
MRPWVPCHHQKRKKKRQKKKKKKTSPQRTATSIWTHWEWDHCQTLSLCADSASMLEAKVPGTVFIQEPKAATDIRIGTNGIPTSPLAQPGQPGSHPSLRRRFCIAFVLWSLNLFDKSEVSLRPRIQTQEERCTSQAPAAGLASRHLGRGKGWHQCPGDRDSTDSSDSPAVGLAKQQKGITKRYCREAKT